MFRVTLASTSMSITELKKDPMSVLSKGEGRTVAILKRNQPVFYAVPAELYEQIIEQFDNVELNAIAYSRLNDNGMRVSLRDL